MMTDKEIAKEVIKANKKMKAISEESGKKVGLILNSAKSMMSKEQHAQYMDITARLLKAKINNESDKVEALTKDLEKIFENDKK